MPQITLDTADAAELAETLQLLSDWLASDPSRLSPSLQDFIGHPAYGTAELRQDVDVRLPPRRQRRRTPVRPVINRATTGRLGDA